MASAVAFMLALGAASAASVGSAHGGALEVARSALERGDKDGDGTMNAAEFSTQLGESVPFRKAVFGALDADRDGLMDAEPFLALEKEGVERRNDDKEAAPVDVARVAIRAADKDGD